MTQKRWKLSVSELGAAKVVAETVVEAGDWMTGLSRARGQIGEKAGMPQGASVSVAPDGRVTVLDPVGRRQYVLLATEEPLAAPAPAPTTPAAATGPAKKKDFKKTMAYMPAQSGDAAPAARAVGAPAIAPAAPSVDVAANAGSSVAATSVAAAPVAAAPVAAAPVAAAPVAAAPVAAAPVAAAPVAAAPAAAAPVAAAPDAAAPAAAAAAPASSPPGKKVSRATVAYMVSPVAAGSAAAPKPVSVAPPAKPASLPPTARPVTVPPPASRSVAPVTASAPAAAPSPVSPPAPEPVAAPAPVVPAAATASHAGSDPELLFSRDSEPSAESPLVYRERNWLLPEGTATDDVELFLRTRFAAMREELKARPKGKLVKLAVFDHRWTGQPQRPPLLVLTWKDWRGEPEVLAPTRLSGPPTSIAPGSLPPPSVAPPPAAPVTAAPVTAAPVTAAPVTAAPVTAAPVAASTSAPMEPPARVSATPPMPDPGPSIVIDPSLTAPDAARTLEDVPAVRTSSPAPSTPPPASATTSSVAPSGRQRTKTDDRLASAFEGMQDLFFLPTPADGAEFLLRLLGELVPSEAASVALYDINTDELRFVAAVGVGADERKGDAVPSQMGLLGSAIRNHDVCLLVDDVAADARFDPGVDGRVGLEPTNLAVMPVWGQGRLLGAVQLLNRMGDIEFTRADGNLLQYLAQRFGEFLHQHKVAEPRRSAPGVRR